jgi:hypothetical protein
MSISEFHKTTAKEFRSIKDRVRLLVDHWGEDGKYKEKIFLNVLSKHLPDKYKVGSGFVVKRKPKTSDEHISSAQIDVIIYNSDTPVLFRESDFVIVTPEAVEAIIEIKTNLQNAKAVEVIEKMHYQGEFIITGKMHREQQIFNGIFSYEGFNDIDELKIKELYSKGSVKAVSDNKYFQFSRVNHISFNEEWFLKYWEHEVGPGKESMYIYNIDELSFSFFISCLLQHLSSEKVDYENSIWFPKKGLVTKDKFKYPS